MKKIIFTFINRYFPIRMLIGISLCSTLLLGNCFAQWVQTSGPQGAGGNCIIGFNNKLFSGTPKGAYYSLNNGNSWTKITGLPSSAIKNFGISFSYIFAATNNGVYRSADNGATWATVNNGLSNLGVRVLLSSGSNLYAGTSNPNGTVSLSTNSGVSWITVLNNVDVTALGSSGSNIYAGTWGGGVRLSTNNGANWTTVNDGLTNLYIYAFTTLGSNVYCGTNAGVFVTSNNGANWSVVNNGITDLNIRSLLTSGTNLFTGTSNGIFLTTNNGANWTSVNNGLISLYTGALAVFENNLFAGTSCGFFRSSNTGTTWSEINNGIIALYISEITSNGNNIFAGSTSGIFLTTDNGNTWTRAGLNNLNVWGPLASLNGNVLASTSGGLFKTSNNGINWTLTNLPTVSIHGFTVDGNNIFAGTCGSGVFFSTDNGSSWTQMNYGLADLDITGIGSSNGVIYAGTLGYGAFRSTNNGTNWSYIGLTDKHLMGFAFPDANTIIAGCCDSLYRSSNNGLTWTDISTGVSLFCENTSLVTYGSNIFLSSCGKIYLTTNGGTNWLLKNQGLENNVITSFHISGNYIYAGTSSSSVWRRTFSEIIKVNNISTEIPYRYMLYQNYPNPFNAETKIKFDIQKSVVSSQYDPEGAPVVTLKIFDILGKEITTLVNEQLQPGTYEVTFDGSNLSSGIYFYQLKSGNYSETKRMILLK